MRRLYDPDHWWLASRRAIYLELLGAQLGTLRVERALEIQSGEGGFLPELEDFAETLCHTELDRRLLKRTAVRGHEHGFVATSRALPFATGAFDLVCWFEGLEEFDDDYAVLCEALRVLRPGGLAMICAPAYPWLSTERARDGGERKRYTRRRMRDVLARAGFEIARTTYAHGALLPATAAASVFHRLWSEFELPKFPRGERRVRSPLLWNRLVTRLLSAERRWSVRFDLPFGRTVATIARRPLGTLAQKQTLAAIRARRARAA
ncbi:MAG: class I SAM-dependent methyltransferase [Planctomycetota bacterium]